MSFERLDNAVSRETDTASKCCDCGRLFYIQPYPPGMRDIDINVAREICCSDCRQSRAIQKLQQYYLREYAKIMDLSKPYEPPTETKRAAGIAWRPPEHPEPPTRCLNCGELHSYAHRSTIIATASEGCSKTHIYQCPCCTRYIWIRVPPLVPPDTPTAQAVTY